MVTETTALTEPLVLNDAMIASGIVLLITFVGICPELEDLGDARHQRLVVR